MRAKMENKNSKNINSTRDTSIDLLKGISMLWIICIWHLLSYSTTGQPQTWSFGGELTMAFMAIFMFYSGYCLTKYSFSKWQDAKTFYMKRIKRFYIPYIISIILLALSGLFSTEPWFVSKTQFVTSILGLSSFVSPAVGTLWFMSMLMFFYIITPLIKSKTKTTHQILIGTTIFALICIINNITNTTDYRFFILMPIYVLGLVTPHRLFNRVKNHWWSLALVTSLGFFKYGIEYLIEIPFTIATIINCILATIGASVICTRINNLLKNNMFYLRSVELIAYILLCAYLFHREICMVLNYILKINNIQLTYYVLLPYIPIIFIASYIIQSLFDKIKLKQE